MSAAVILRLEVDDKGNTKLIQLGQNLDNAKKKAESFTATVGGMFKSMVLYSAFEKFISQVREATDEIFKFNKAFVEVQAISGRTNPQGATAVAKMVEELKTLTLAMSNFSEISAAKYAEVALTLTKLGVPVNEIKIIEQSLADLATTTGTDLIEATTGAIQISRSFGLELGGVTEAAHIMATTVLSTEDTFVNYMEAMKMVAPIAHSLNVSLEETSLYIGALGNLGLRGTMGGTALKNMLLNLLRPAEEVKNKLKGLGLEGKKFYEVLYMLKGTSVIGLLETFNLRAIPGALGLMNMLSEKIEYLFNLIESKKINVGDVAKDIRLAWENQLLMLKNNLINVFIEFSRVFEKAGSGEVFSNLINFLRDLQTYIKDHRDEIRRTVQTWINGIALFANKVIFALGFIGNVVKGWIVYKLIAGLGVLVAGVTTKFMALGAAAMGAAVTTEAASAKASLAINKWFGVIGIIISAYMVLDGLAQKLIDKQDKMMAKSGGTDTNILKEKVEIMKKILEFQRETNEGILVQAQRIRNVTMLMNQEDLAMTGDLYRKLQNEIHAYNDLILMLDKYRSQVNKTYGGGMNIPKMNLPELLPVFPRDLAAFEDLLPPLQETVKAFKELESLTKKLSSKDMELYVKSFINPLKTIPETIRKADLELRGLMSILNKRAEEEKAMEDFKKTVAGIESLMGSLEDAVAKTEGKEPFNAMQMSAAIAIQRLQTLNLGVISVGKSLSELALPDPFKKMADEAEEIYKKLSAKAIVDFTPFLDFKPEFRAEFFKKQYLEQLQMFLKTDKPLQIKLKSVMSEQEPSDFNFYLRPFASLWQKQHESYLEEKNVVDKDWKYFISGIENAWKKLGVLNLPSIFTGKEYNATRLAPLKNFISLALNILETGIPLINAKVKMMMEQPIVKGLMNTFNSIGDAYNNYLGALETLNAARLQNMQSEHEAELNNIAEVYDKKRLYAESDADYTKYLNDKQAKEEKALKALQAQEEMEYRKKAQDIAVKQALINGALAITNILANSPFMLWPVLIPFTIAATALQVKAIKAQKLKGGGGVRGAGTETSDSVPIMASVGEYVVNANLVKKNGGFYGVERKLYGKPNNDVNVNLYIDNWIGDKKFTNLVIDSIRKELPKRL